MFTDWGNSEVIKTVVWDKKYNLIEKDDIEEVLDLKGLGEKLKQENGSSTDLARDLIGDPNLK